MPFRRDRAEDDSFVPFCLDDSYPNKSDIALYFPSRGDDPIYANPTFDDSHWAAAEGGVDWRTYSSAFASHNVTGWYRQHLAVTNRQLCNGSATVTLSPGIIMGSDETYLNGVKIGATGDITAPNQGGVMLACSLGVECACTYQVPLILCAFF